MSVQHANRGIVKKDLQLYYNREFVKSFRGEATINTCDLNSRVDYVWANGVKTRDTTAPSPPPITGFEIAKLRSTDGADTQTILYTAAVDQVNGGVYTHSAYIYLESGTWVSVGQHWNPWNYGVQTYIPLNKWTRVSFTVTNSAANYGQVACSYNTNGTIYITATQYEKKSYSTPFVNGSRTANTIAGGGGLLDISGNNVNSNLSNVLFNSSGYYFGGTNNYIQSANVFNLGGSDYTIDGWFYLDSSTSSDDIYRTIFCIQDSVTSNNWIELTKWRSGVYNNGLYYDYNKGAYTSYARVDTGSENAVAQWIHFACTRNGNTTQLFLNSVSKGTATITDTWSSNSYLLIGLNSYYAQYMKGQVPQLRIYSRSLTAAEVLQNFNATRKTYGI